MSRTFIVDCDHLPGTIHTVDHDLEEATRVMEQDSNSQDFAQSPLSDQELLFEKLNGNTDTDQDPSPTATIGMKSKFSRILQKAKNLTDAEGPAETDGKLALKREITPLSGIGFVVGQLIGSGIFITPSNILGYTGSFGLSMACWIIGAVVALAGALCYFELGLLVRKAGGEYAILLEAYSFRKKNRWVEMLGSLVSFLFTWTTVFVLRGASASIITLTCARYLSRPFFIDCDVPESVVKLIALAALRKFLCLTICKYNVHTCMHVVEVHVHVSCTCVAASTLGLTRKRM